MPLHGGVMQVDEGRGRSRRWSAVDLTPSARGLGAWSVTELAQYFKTGVSARAGSFGPMNEVIANSLSQLSSEDLHSIAVYLKSLPARAYGAASIPPQLAGAGAGIYKERCEKCHGRSGRGGMFSGPPLQGSAVVQAADPASLINIIVYGPGLPKEISYGQWDTMPSYASILSDAQVAAVCNYVRGSWGNRGPAVSSKMVAGQR